MKQHLIYKFSFLFVLLSFLSQEAKSQIVDNEPWCPPGATWVYEMFSPTSYYFLKLSYEKDTAINNIIVKKLTVSTNSPMYLNDMRPNWYYRGDEFMYESNDSIFWYDKVNEDFKFIYSFSPSLGDNFVVGNSRANCDNSNIYPVSDTIFVTSIDKDTSFDGRIFDAQITSYDRLYRLGKIVSKIGSLEAPFPQINSINTICQDIETGEYGSYYRGLVCYSDAIRGSVQFSQNYDNTLCHYIRTNIDELPAVGNNEQNTQNRYSLYPNPVNRILNVMDLEGQQIEQLSIYSIDGTLIFEENSPRESNPSIDISHFSNGFYLIKIRDSQNNSTTLKFLKNDL